MASSDEEALCRAIADDPCDLGLKTVYADLLEEQGDLRAPCLRAEAEAARILGPRSVHGVFDVERYFGAAYTPEQLAVLALLPFSEETLRARKDTHILVAGFPL